MMFHCLPMIMRRLTPWYMRPLVLITLVLQLGCQRQTVSPTRPPSFDQEHAYTLLKDLCTFGPRNHGSESKLKAEKWIDLPDKCSAESLGQVGRAVMEAIYGD